MEPSNSKATILKVFLLISLVINVWMHLNSMAMDYYIEIKVHCKNNEGPESYVYGETFILQIPTEIEYKCKNEEWKKL